MKNITLLCTTLLLCFMAISCNGQSGEKQTEVLLQTTAGDIRIRLFNDTPIHRDNFVRNVKDGKYDGVSFHRVIRNFMIQTGDPNTRPGHEAELAAAEADSTGLGDTIRAEILFPKYIHKRGMIGAARQGDDINPTKASDAYQFYIVTGRFQNEQAISGFEQNRIQQRIEEVYNRKVHEHATRIDELRAQRDTGRLSDYLENLQDEARLEVDDNPPALYTQDQIRSYRTYGGAPWLDGGYTIFGEVVEGMKIVLSIEKAKTDKNDKPLSDIRIVKASVVE